MLPASVRGTFADRIDPRLAVILGASIVIHFLVALAALVHDIDYRHGIAERAFNQTFKPEEYRSTSGSRSRAKPPTKAPRPRRSSRRSRPREAGTAPKPDAGPRHEDDIAPQEDQARAMADLLTGEGDNGTAKAT